MSDMFPTGLLPTPIPSVGLPALLASQDFRYHGVHLADDGSHLSGPVSDQFRAYWDQRGGANAVLAVFYEGKWWPAPDVRPLPGEFKYVTFDPNAKVDDPSVGVATSDAQVITVMDAQAREIAALKAQMAQLLPQMPPPAQPPQHGVVTDVTGGVVQ